MARSHSDTRCWDTRDRLVRDWDSWEEYKRERERGGRKMEGRRKRREQISLATIMKHHLITGLVMKWNSRTILFDFCVIFRPMKGGSV